MAMINWIQAVDPVVTAQNAKIVELNVSLEGVLAQGFTSSADGTARQYPLDPTSMIKWSGAMSVIDSNTVTNPLLIKDINGDKITVTPEQFKQLATDGFNFFMQQEQHLWNLEAQVEACTTVDMVNAITWETPDSTPAPASSSTTTTAPSSTTTTTA